MSDTVVRGAVYKGSYRDSVELMGIAADLEKLPGVTRAGLVMATPANRRVLDEAGLLAAAPGDAGPNDLVVALTAESEEAAAAAIERAGELLRSSGSSGAGATGAGGTGAGGGGGAVEPPHTLADGVNLLGSANLAVISTPGTYATAESLKALKAGLNVFLFSDNVSVEDEIELKAVAGRKGLLVMGPDCGTAIVGGVPLGFANAVRRGTIGVVGASGTGTQEVTSLIHRFGAGVSHALGTGGRDLDERVGGATMLAALGRLAADNETAVLVLISKPPSPRVAEAVLASVKNLHKPVVVSFIGGDPAAIRAASATPAETFEHAASCAVALSRGEPPPEGRVQLDPELEAAADQAAAGLADSQNQIRGLFSGGSLAGEAKLLLKRAFGDGVAEIIDLGEDEYTVGRPHPMIDPRLRNEFIGKAARDPAIAVVLFDLVLGYGSNPDPAGAMAGAIGEARATAERDGRGLVFVASICGTEDDFQGFDRQSATLRDAGVLLASSNSRAATLAARLIARSRQPSSATIGGSQP